MNNQVFVPVTDELIYNHPEQIEGPLIPYSAGMECSQWLAIEINPDEERPAKVKVAKSEKQIKVVAGKLVTTLAEKTAQQTTSKSSLTLASSK